MAEIRCFSNEDVDSAVGNLQPGDEIYISGTGRGFSGGQASVLICPPGEPITVRCWGQVYAFDVQGPGQARIETHATAVVTLSKSTHWSRR